MTSPRRFPPPWSIEDGAACFIVRDYDKQALAYVYFEDEPGRRSAAKLLARDEAAAGRFHGIIASIIILMPANALSISR
jgi:hypothetical protein